MTHKNSTTQSGFTLLELLLVIGVAALLLIGGIATYRLVTEGNRATEATRLLLTIRQQAQVLAQQQNGAYTGMDFDSATSNTASPFVASGTLRDQQRSPFNGNITITPTNALGVNDDTLQVVMDNIPRSACTKMFLAVTAPTDIVSVNGSLSDDGSGGNNITAANAATACAGETNTLTWVFR